MSPHDRFRLVHGDRVLAGRMAHYQTATAKRDRMNEYNRSTGKGSRYRVQGRRKGSQPEAWEDLS